MRNGKAYLVLAMLGLFIATRFPLGGKNDLKIYDTARWWDNDSPFRILRIMNQVRVPFFLSHFPSGSEIRPLVVLDVGCGGGLVSEAIAQVGVEKNFNVTGIDISAPSIAVASEHARLHHRSPNLSFRVGSVYALPFADDSVDVVVISDVLEHLSDVDSAIKEIFRVLRPKTGTLVFDTIARTWWSWLSTYFVAQEILGMVAPGAHDWSMFINPEELAEILTSNGFATKVNEWAGIVPDLSPRDAFMEKSIYHLIKGFRKDSSDLSASYMGFARKD